MAFASFDEENRLTAFPAGAQVWGAGYRSDGLRAWTRKTATGAKTYYYYDQGNAVLETKSDGTIVGMNIFAPDGLVTRWSKLSGTIPVVGDYQFDWQGNAVHCLFSGARYADEPLIHSAYNAWGQRNFVYSNGASSAADLLRFGYNARWGYKLDTETGLYYCQHRYYDPANGRWVTRDPIRERGGVNLYSYCGNSLTLVADEFGKWDGMGTPVETPIPEPPAWFPLGPGVGPGAGVGAGMAVGATAVTAGCAVAVGAGLGYLVGSGLDTATNGGWGNWWGLRLGVIAEEDSSELVNVVWYDPAAGKWGRPFHLRSGDEDCDWEYDQNSSACRKMKNVYKRRACWEAAFKIYRNCLAAE